MRSQLLFAGLLVIGLGFVFYVTALPLVFFWSFPFVLGGIVMVLASPFVKESEGHVEAPEGTSFCVFCTTPVPLEAERCPHCGGLQPVPRQGKVK